MCVAYALGVDAEGVDPSLLLRRVGVPACCVISVRDWLELIEVPALTGQVGV